MNFWMNFRTNAGTPRCVSGRPSLPPHIKTEAEVIGCDAVDIETFAVGTENRDKLRREVQHLTELHFASAQFLLCLFTFSDVDHGTREFDELARRAENRMANAVNVPDGATRVHNAIIQFFV